MTVAPSAAMSSAAARPCPPAVSVTRATFPASRPLTGDTRRASLIDFTHLVEVEAKLADLADLAVILGTLRAALDAGPDDPVAYAQSECCPLPFGGLASPGR